MSSPASGQVYEKGCLLHMLFKLLRGYSKLSTVYFQHSLSMFVANHDETFGTVVVWIASEVSHCFAFFILHPNWSGETEPHFFAACQDDRKSDLDRLLEKGADPSPLGEWAMPMHWFPALGSPPKLLRPEVLWQARPNGLARSCMVWQVGQKEEVHGSVGASTLKSSSNISNLPKVGGLVTLSKCLVMIILQFLMQKSFFARAYCIKELLRVMPEVMVEKDRAGEVSWLPCSSFWWVCSRGTENLPPCTKQVRQRFIVLLQKEIWGTVERKRSMQTIYHGKGTQDTVWQRWNRSL